MIRYRTVQRLPGVAHKVPQGNRNSGRLLLNVLLPVPLLSNREDGRNTSGSEEVGGLCRVLGTTLTRCAQTLPFSEVRLKPDTTYDRTMLARCAQTLP